MTFGFSHSLPLKRISISKFLPLLANKSGYFFCMSSSNSQVASPTSWFFHKTLTKGIPCSLVLSFFNPRVALAPPRKPETHQSRYLLTEACELDFGGIS